MRQPSLFSTPPPAEAAPCPPANSERNRRTRLAPRKGRSGPRLPPKIHSWLIRTTRVHAHLCYLVRVFAQPAANNVGETIEARAARRDRTLLYDCWTHAANELEQLRTEVAAEMEPPATKTRPGSAERVEELRRRAERLQDLFADGDER